MRHLAGQMVGIEDVGALGREHEGPAVALKLGRDKRDDLAVGNALAVHPVESFSLHVCHDACVHLGEHLKRAVVDDDPL